MKAVISNRIYMECTESYRKELDKTLTHIIPSYNPNDPPQVIKNMARVRENIVSIPVGRIDLIPYGYEIVDKRILAPTDFPDCKFTLRDSQQEVYDSVNDNCIINAHPSWGKTFCGLAIASKLKQKTLIVTHNVNLRSQWEKEVKKVIGRMPGIIGSGRLEIDHPIVVGNIQTLYRNIPLIQREFGTVILDEMHHVSADTFSRIIDSNHARYKIGLSATVNRKDGKHVVFKDYFGDTILRPPRENMMTPTVDIIKTDIRFPDGARTPWANRVTALTQSEEYVRLIAVLASSYAAIGHKVLVVCDRTAFLKNVAELIGDKAVVVVGEVLQEDRDILQNQISMGEKEILCGTQAIYAEGISINALSCIILATPLNNDPLLEQLIGRICRIETGKLNPIVVDLHLLGNTATRQASARIGHYMREGYRLRQISSY